MHADTYFGDGPAAADPGQVRGLGTPTAITATAARELARGRAGTGSTNALLADETGHLQRLVRLGAAPEGGWTRDSLTTAVCHRLAREARSDPLTTGSYTPTTAIRDHVRAAYPTSTRPGCHRWKTLHLRSSTMGTDGTITWTTTTGQHHTHGPEPLPGHATGEAHWQPHTQVTTRPAV